MRDILFRGKRFDNGEWVYSMTISEGTIKRKRGKFYMELSEGVWKQVIPETVSQFTGLLDKNGTRIFEGDRVAVNYGRYELEKQGLTRTGVVVYEEMGFLVKIDNSEVRVIRGTIHSIEITGNIHDNEL